MRLKINKNDVILFGLIWIMMIILNNAFLHMHYSSDTYCLIDFGYMNYPKEYFLRDGRLISSLVCFFAGIIHLPYKEYIIGMDFIGIIFISLSIFILYKYILKITKRNSKQYKFLMLLSVWILVYNPFAIEYLLFPESAVMCFGVFLTVLAGIISDSESNIKYLKIFGLLLLASICYQPVILAFPVLFLLLKFLNNEKQDKFLIKNWKSIIVYFLIFLIIFIINLVLIRISAVCFNSDMNRKILDEERQNISERVRRAFYGLYIILKTNLNLLPHNTSIIMIMISLPFLLNMKDRKQNIINYFLIIIVSILGVLGLFLLFPPQLCGRMNYAIGMICGISMMFILQLFQENKHIINYVISIIIIIIFLIYSIEMFQNSNEHILANIKDDEIGNQIRDLVDNYEKETGVKVTKIEYKYDINSLPYAKGIKRLGSLTESKFSCEWSIMSAFNYYCDRKFEKVDFSDEIYEKYFIDMDFEYFCTDEIVFNEDTLYFIIY